MELSKLHEIEMFAVMILMNEYEEAFRSITLRAQLSPTIIKFQNFCLLVRSAARSGKALCFIGADPSMITEAM